MRHLPLTPSLIALVVMVGCSNDENAGHNDRDAGASLPDALPQPIHPKLQLTTPERGVFSPFQSVLVTGAARAGSAAIDRLRVNGEETPLTADGTFERSVSLNPGPNIVDLRLEAADLGRAVDAITVFGGPTHPPGEPLEDALRIHLGPSLLDDDDPDLDDLARVFEVLLVDEGYLSQMTEEPFEASGMSLTVSHIDIEAAAVDIRPAGACLFVALDLGGGAAGGIELSFETSGAASLLGTQVTLDADRVEIRGHLCPKMEDAEPDLIIEVGEVEVALTNLVLSTDEYPDLIDEVPAIHDALTTLLKLYIANWLSDSLGELTTELLRGFAFERTFDLATVSADSQAPPLTEGLWVTVSFGVDGLWASDHGLDLSLSGSFSAPLGLARAPVDAGSLRTDDPPPNGPFSDRPLAVAISDDALNQLLFATWWGGMTASFEFPLDALSELPEVFQPLTSFTTNANLPATVLPATEDEYLYDLAIGELGLEILAGTDRRFDVSLHLRAGVAIDADDEGLLSMRLDDRARLITVHAAALQVPSFLDPGDVAALFRLMMPALLGEAEVRFGGFPIPVIEFDLLGENVQALAGRGLTLSTPTVRRTGAGGGYLVVEGDAVERRSEP